MARTYITGFELGAVGEFRSDDCTYSTIHKRSGSFGLFCNGSCLITDGIRTSGGTLVAFARSARFYLNVLTLPTGACVIYLNQNGVPTIFDQLIINAAGTLTVTDGTNAATSTLALTVDGLFHRIEFDVGWSSGSGRRVFVDGVQWASTAVGTSAAQDFFELGIITGTVGGQLAFDDLLIDNDTFVNSGFPGNGTITLLLSTSDNTVGTWTGGAGGTTSEFDALNNIPPVGVVLASATNTSQVKNVATGTTSDGSWNCQTYTAAGISGTVNVVQALADHGNGSTTSLSGGLWVSSNPTQTAPGTTFNYGLGSGSLAAAGTYPTHWATIHGPASVAPAVTLGSSPVVNIRKSTSNVAAAMCDFLGVYVDWSASTADWLKESYWWQSQSGSSGTF